MAATVRDTKIVRAWCHKLSPMSVDMQKHTPIILRVAHELQLALFAAPKKRPRLGRPPKKGSLLSHRVRAIVSPHHPHHVTVRMRQGTWNLRSQRGFACIATALREVRARRADF